MQNIGDRLAEARKRLGIALREASEATKIRTDYLQAMENGTFDFSLPEVYKRGFLKIYANYLKLDADKLANEYSSLAAGGSRGDRENLGRVDAPGGLGSAGAVPREREQSGDYDNSRAQDQAAMVRLIVYVGGAAVLIVLMILGFKHLLDSSTGADESSKTANATLSSNTSTASTPAPVPAPAPTLVAPPVPTTNKFNFSASGDIASLVITDDAGHQLFSGPFKKGNQLPLTVKSRVAINVSQVQYLSIQKNNDRPQSIADANGKPVKGPLYFYWPPGTP
jgi:cytoskeletal protein RodZ